MEAKSTISRFKRATAHRLRVNATEAEKQLWRHLRALETRGTHFRRQQPIGNYVADFACLAARVVIEVDGSQHGEADAIRKDSERTKWLEGEGYRVLRFWNSDVSGNIDGVLETIYAALYGSRDVEPRPIKHRRRKKVE